MRVIINGVRYDTEAAELIGRHDSNLPVTDFGYYSESLYRTPRSGRYFLYGRGGPASRYAESAGVNTWTGGERVIPFDTRDEAFAWAQKNLDAELVEREFADLIVDA